MVLTRGWLKPRLLLDITGTPAAEVAAKEIADKKKLERKKRLIEEYKFSLGLISSLPDSTSYVSNDDSSPDKDPTKPPVIEDKTRNQQRRKTLQVVPIIQS
jgi:hypothetical protein